MFLQDCVSSIIDSILESNLVCDEPPLVDNNKLEGIARNAALFTQAQLTSLVFIVLFYLIRVDETF